jgi:hypothetical protein
MPHKGRFQHAPVERASSGVLVLKLPVSSWTAAEAANYDLAFILHLFFRTNGFALRLSAETGKSYFA